MSDAKSFWDYKADAWQQMTSSADSYYARRSLLVLELVQHQMREGCVLDVGCGSGALCCEFIKRGYDAYGTDLSTNMIERALRLASALIREPEAHFRVSSGECPPFAIQFDVITAIGVFPYVSDYERYLAFLATQIKPGGYIVASCTNRLSLYTAVLIADHLKKLRRGKGWRAVLINLIRTGVWSGGYVDYTTARQCYSSACFDVLFHRAGFQLVDSLDLFNIGALQLDLNPFRRSRLGRWCARHLGWNHIGMYRRA